MRSVLASFFGHFTSSDGAGKHIILLAVKIEVSFVSPFPRWWRSSRWERNLQKSPGLSLTSFQTARGIVLLIR
jgi:hypothetical protein